MERLRPGDKVYSPQFGRGEVLGVDGFGESERIRIQFEGGEIRELSTEQFNLERMEGQVPARIPMARETGPARFGSVEEEEDRMIQEEIRTAVRQALQDLLGIGPSELTGRWAGGTLVLKPGKETTQAKEVPLDAFFHKIVMVRDQLRVLEQKINAHPKLTEEEKVSLQHYVTRCYGSLTTFNILFQDPEDRFGGE